MSTSVLLTVSLLIPAAPIPKDRVVVDNSPPPVVWALKPDAKGVLNITGRVPTKKTMTYISLVKINDEDAIHRDYKDEVVLDYFAKTLTDFEGKLQTLDGKPLTLEQAIDRVKGGALLLASRDGKPISSVWLRGFAKDSVQIIAEGFEHVLPEYSSPFQPTAPATPSPRLALLTTDGSGHVTCETNRGVGKEPGKGTDGGIRIERLADITFDAYAMDGTVISKPEVLKRLAKGGMVIVAGDKRIPDERYLKNMSSDLILLVSPDLILPRTTLDRTRRDFPNVPKTEKEMQEELKAVKERIEKHKKLIEQLQK